MNDNFYRLDLTQDEACQLHGMTARPEIIEIVHRALRDKEMNLPPLFGEAIKEGEKSGVLKVISTSITYCNVCRSSWGYHNHTRNNSRKRIVKGTPNHKEPVYKAGIEFQTVPHVFIRFVMKGFKSGVCMECWEKSKDRFFQTIIDNELPIDFGTYGDYVSLFELKNTLTCFECGKENLASSFKKLSAIMSGYYPGECPECGAKQLPFGKTHKSGHRLERK